MVSFENKECKLTNPYIHTTNTDHYINKPKHTTNIDYYRIKKFKSAERKPSDTAAGMPPTKIFLVLKSLV